jgi:hypothetical protein
MAAKCLYFYNYLRYISITECLTIKIKNLSWGQHWFILTFDDSTTQEFYMNEISSMDFPQHGELFYFYGQVLHTFIHTTHALSSKGKQRRLRYSSETPTFYQNYSAMRNLQTRRVVCPSPSNRSLFQV